MRRSDVVRGGLALTVLNNDGGEPRKCISPLHVVIYGTKVSLQDLM